MKSLLPALRTTGGSGDAPQSRRRWSQGAIGLLALLLGGMGLVKICAPPPELWAEEAARGCSGCPLGLCVLWSRAPQVGQALTLGLAWVLRQSLVLPQAWGLGMLAPLIHGARLCALRVPPALRWEAGLALLSMTQWAYYSLTALHHEKSKALQLLLWVALQQLLTSLLTRGLDRLWAAMGRVARAVMCNGLRPLGRTAPEELHGITTTRLAPSVPLSQRFCQPMPAASPPASTDLCLIVGDKEASEAGGGCRFTALGTRFQSSGTSRSSATTSLSKQALSQQGKATCVLIILLYIYALSLFVQILK